MGPELQGGATSAVVNSVVEVGGDTSSLSERGHERNRVAAELLPPTFSAPSCRGSPGATYPNLICKHAQLVFPPFPAHHPPTQRRRRIFAALRAGEHAPENTPSKMCRLAVSKHYVAERPPTAPRERKLRSQRENAMR